MTNGSSIVIRVRSMTAHRLHVNVPDFKHRRPYLSCASNVSIMLALSFDLLRIKPFNDDPSISISNEYMYP
ncbi:hypothetical protein NHJ6243_007665 [Beauveria neobassiana]